MKIFYNISNSRERERKKREEKKRKEKEILFVNKEKILYFFLT